MITPDDVNVPIRRLTPEEAAERKRLSDIRTAQRSDELARERKEKRKHSAHARLHADHGVVYVIECAGVFKIGTTTNLATRLRTIGSMCPMPVRLVAKMHGGRQTEMLLHDRFRERHSHGEWFRLTDDDVAQIQKMVRP